MSGSYDGFRVLLSLCVALLASYTALTLASRIAAASSAVAQRVWLLLGAVVMGVGIWSMHFVGMLALSLPIATGYDIGITLVSLLAAIAASGMALHTSTRQHFTWRSLLAGGALMGAGIVTMHYLGMEAMGMSPAIQYSPGLLLLSILIAGLASVAALWIANALRVENLRHLIKKRLAASAVMAVAIAGMHYTGMAAATFLPGAVCTASGAGSLHSAWLSLLVGGATLALLAVTLVISALEGRYAASNRNLTGSLDKLNIMLLRMATIDTLTDLPNRHSLIKAAEQAIQSARQHGRLCAILFMDLDGFKSINDTLGHSVGDGMLRAFAQRLRGCVRQSDLVARMGGDEFVVVLDGLLEAEDAARIARNINTAMHADLQANGTALKVTPSIGIALYPRDADTVDGLIGNADIAMYESKQAGGNTFRFYDVAMGQKAQRTTLLQRGLQEAITRGHFVLYFQPKFDGRSRRLTGAEALIRWRHPSLGLIPPAEFIPVAERSGQIIEIGNWVLARVCDYLVEWDAQGKSPLKMAINLSPLQLRWPGVVQKMQAIVAAAGIAPARIMLEITESVAMQDAELTARVIREYHDAGFQIAIDDFGTGYSSLAYLQQFRVEQLKIDRFFTNGLDVSGEEGRAIVSAIVALAHSLNMEVVAEGVETVTQLDALRLLDCDQVQGFLLEHPMAAEAFAQFLANQDASDAPPPSQGMMPPLDADAIPEPA
jgi:diguanylate cyclase (GGDEF)-like protein